MPEEPIRPYMTLHELVPFCGLTLSELVELRDAGFLKPVYKYQTLFTLHSVYVALRKAEQSRAASAKYWSLGTVRRDYLRENVLATVKHSDGDENDEWQSVERPDL